MLYLYLEFQKINVDMRIIKFDNFKVNESSEYPKYSDEFILESCLSILKKYLASRENDRGSLVSIYSNWINSIFTTLGFKSMEVIDMMRDIKIDKEYFVKDQIINAIKKTNYGDLNNLYSVFIYNINPLIKFIDKFLEDTIGIEDSGLKIFVTQLLGRLDIQVEVRYDILDLEEDLDVKNYFNIIRTIKTEIGDLYKVKVMAIHQGNSYITFILKVFYKGDDN